ncbi:MAG TPA: NAD(P)/FAD-dependent oxidoreductase [Flavitalea sp.]|nr:NAD(P)/FAD-dependent oxidoreductase [Flavitalea sp.]
MPKKYNIIIVGARCAGATLAIYLARAGMSVLLLDKDELPSDQILSTHTIHPPGIDILDEVGVGEAVREVCPPSPTFRLNKNGSSIDITCLEGRAQYCPRRKRLDGLLQDAALQEGVELMDRTRLIKLEIKNDRVIGVRVINLNTSQESVFMADLVIGADGRHSSVAQMIVADEYLAYECPRAMYWAYWNATAIWKTDSQYPFDMYLGNTFGDIRVIFQTDYDQLLIGSLPSAEKAQNWRGDPLTSLISDLSSDPVIAPLIEGLNPDGKVRGTIKERFFFRQAVGPGWALVGDSGHHKEFVIGDGITEALLQARSLSVAIIKGSDKELVKWWRARDVEALPLFYFGQDEGSLTAPGYLDGLVLKNMNKETELKKRLALIMEHKLSPFDAFPVSKIFKWTIGAALEGKPGVIPAFFEKGKRAAFVNRQLKGRMKLLAEAESAM